MLEQHQELSKTADSDLARIYGQIDKGLLSRREYLRSLEKEVVENIMKM